ncbi:MAG: vitamin B12 dependent-methionine synthase activation domain-containing protein [Elusimicrobiales bacterium]
MTDIPTPPDFERHIVDDFDSAELDRRLNRRMLYNAQLGVKGDVAELEKTGDARFLSLKKQAGALLGDAVARGIFAPLAAYRFLPAQSGGNSITVYNPADRTFAPVIFDFPRQPEGEKLCLADFVGPSAGGKMDYIAMFVCTCGGGFAREAARLREAGRLADSHILNALAAVYAEAIAEAVHARIRREWFGCDEESSRSASTGCGGKCAHGGFCGPAPKGRGERYSFGYPACPALEQQEKLFSLLSPGDIGVTLTESFMMEPEASVSALALHNPRAKLFAI